MWLNSCFLYTDTQYHSKNIAYTSTFWRSRDYQIHLFWWKYNISHISVQNQCKFPSVTISIKKLTNLCEFKLIKMWKGIHRGDTSLCFYFSTLSLEVGKILFFYFYFYFFFFCVTDWMLCIKMLTHGWWCNFLWFFFPKYLSYFYLKYRVSSIIIASKKLKMLCHRKNIAGWTLTNMSVHDAPYFPPLEQ